MILRGEGSDISQGGWESIIAEHPPSISLASSHGSWEVPGWSLACLLTCSGSPYLTWRGILMEPGKSSKSPSDDGRCSPDIVRVHPRRQECMEAHHSSTRGSEGRKWSISMAHRPRACLIDGRHPGYDLYSFQSRKHPQAESVIMSPQPDLSRRKPCVSQPTTSPTSRPQRHVRGQACHHPGSGAGGRGEDAWIA